MGESLKKTDKKQKPSIFSRPILWIMLTGFILVAAVPVGLLGLKLYQVAWEEAWREITEKHQLLAQNLAAPISIYVNDQKTALSLLGDFVAYITDAEISQYMAPEQKDMISRSMKKLTGFRSISLVNLHGKILLSTRGKFPVDQRGTLATETCYLKTRQHDRWFLSGVKASPFDKRPSVVLSIPVHGKQGKQLAVLVGELRIDTIEKIRRKIKFGKKGHSAIVDHNGRAVAHPNPDWMSEMRDLSQWPIVQKMINGKTGVTEFYSPFMGASMVAGYASVPGIKWGIMVPQPKPEVEAHVNRILHTQLIWGLAGLGLALLIGFMLVRWISFPLKRLCVSASRIAENNFTGDLPGVSRHAPREIRTLSERISSLLKGLQKSREQLDELNQSLQRRVHDATQELRGANRQLQIFASQDYLTRLYNRRYFESSLLQILSGSDNRVPEVCLMMIDIDNFKPINDRFGHAAGDQILVQVAALVKSIVTEEHLVARYAGDEFVILLADGTVSAEMLADEILDKANNTIFEWQGEVIEVTLSIGLVCQKTGAGCNLDMLMQHVDQALFTAKEEGRNKVSVSKRGLAG